MHSVNYETLIRQAPFAYALYEVVFDENSKPSDFTFLETNESYEKMTGLKLENIVGKKLTEVLSEIGSKGFDWVSVFSEVARNGSEKNFEFYSIPLARWYRVRVSSLGNDLITTIFYDISSEKHRAEELERFFSVNLDLLCIADMDGHLLKVNQTWREILGYTEEELEQNLFLDFVHPDDHLATIEAVEKLKNNQSVPNFVNRYRSKEGSYRYIEWRSVSSGKLIYAAGRDITQRLLEQREVEASRDHLENILSHVPAIIYSLAEAGGIAKFTNNSRNVEKILGHTPEDFYGDLRFQSDHIHPEDRPKVKERLRQEPIQGSYELGEYRLRNKVGDYQWIYDKQTITIQPDGNREIIGAWWDITELKNAELQLKEAQRQIREQEARYTSLFNQSHDAVFLLDLLGKIVDSNKRAEELSGFTRAELKGLRFDKTCDVSGLSQQILERLLVGEKLPLYERSFVRKNGSTVPVELSTELALDENDNPSHIQCVIRDISERKEIERKLIESEDNFRTFFETMEEMIFVADKEGHFLYTNGALKEKLGYTIEELMGMHTLDTYPAQNRKEAEGIFAEMLAGKRTTCVLPLVRKDQSLIPVEARVWYGKWGGQECLFGVSKDLTQEQAALQLFNKVFEKNPTMMALSSASENRFFEVNPAFVERTGYTREETLGKNPEELGLACEPEMNRLVQDTISKDGSIHNMEIKLRTKNQEVLEGLLSGEAIEIQGQKMHLTVMTDITAQKKAEALALQASRAKSDFLANMSHEIRTPLNGVVGFAELLQKTPLNLSQQQYVENLVTSARSLMEIINEILDFSKIEAGKLELEKTRTDLAQLVESTVDIVKLTAAKKGLELLLSIQPKMPRYAVVDSVRLKQILVNILGNAVKFTQVGEVEMSLTFDWKEDGKAAFHFSIRDTGIGIDSDQKKRLFNAFTQADSSVTRKYGGTGLGLAISSLLAKKMGSEIRVESEKGKGSTFSFSVEALCEPDAESPFAPETPIHRALIVDDNRRLCQILQEQLKAWQIDAEICEDGLSALKAISQSGPYDVLLIDSQMPYLDGLQTIRIIRDKYERTPDKNAIILLNAELNGPRIAEAQRGFSLQGILDKPVKTTALRTVLENLYTRAPTSEVFQKTETEEFAITVERIPHILVVEDNPLNMLLIRTILKEIVPNAILTEADNGLQAVEAYENAPFDLILMDVQMPEMSGLEAAERIRKSETGTQRRVPIIALTARAIQGEEEKCLKAGMDDFLTKPVNQVALRNILVKHFSSILETPAKEHQPSEIKTEVHFDKESFLGQINHRQDVFQSIIRSVLLEFGGYLKEFGQMIAQGDPSTIRQKAHALKGIALNMFFPKMSKYTEEVEKNSESLSRDELEDYYARMLAEWALIKKELGD
ncbi:MAG: PAS domain S-box protein [Thermotogota bacterium]